MKKSKDCIFCKIAKDEISDMKIKESDNFFAIKDKYPNAEGHTLVIPKKHFVTILDIPNTLAPELLKMIKDVASTSSKTISKSRARPSCMPTST